jgi:hypothetical protein
MSLAVTQFSAYRFIAQKVATATAVHAASTGLRRIVDTLLIAGQRFRNQFA